jgi:hypothetical protein
VLLIAVVVWAILVILYAAKWIWARAEALAEFPLGTLRLLFLGRLLPQPLSAAPAH